MLCRRCGERRSLQELRQPMAMGHCQGWRPWLRTNDEGCQQPLKLMNRTGSNVWFPQTISVLSLPGTGGSVRRKVDAVWESLKNVQTLSELSFLLGLVESVRDALDGEKPPEVLEAIQQRRSGAPEHAPAIREAEWAVLHEADFGEADDLPPRDEPWFAVRLELDDLPPFIERVVVVSALREVRALVGFTRLQGTPVTPEGEPELEGQTTAPLSEGLDWIPAVEIHGEGVFLAFDEAALAEWEGRDAVVAREAAFREGLRRENASRNTEHQVEAFTSARLLMLHSLAHMLITQISLECGYSASAIRERIYCYRDPEGVQNRAGILLYTGTPGSEGTLGGLVEVGRDIVRHLRLAVERNRICSNDPVCS